MCVLKTMPFKPAFLNLPGATDALQRLENLQPLPSPKLPQPADHLGTNAGNKLGILANKKHITVKTFRKWEGVVGTGWGRLRIGTGGGHL
jgi:hypothetical protein